MIALYTIMIMSSKRVSDAAPVQVYLDLHSRDRLDRLAERLETTKSDILRRGLIALEREASDPLAHPVLRLAVAGQEVTPAPAYDVAREHDRFLATVNGPTPVAAPRRRSPRTRG